MERVYSLLCSQKPDIACKAPFGNEIGNNRILETAVYFLVHIRSYVHRSCRRFITAQNL